MQVERKKESLAAAESEILAFPSPPTAFYGTPDGYLGAGGIWGKLGHRQEGLPQAIFKPPYTSQVDVAI
jgi:hypothetical protein